LQFGDVQKHAPKANNPPKPSTEPKRAAKILHHQITLVHPRKAESSFPQENERPM
jgi:hypothetical protein